MKSESVSGLVMPHSLWPRGPQPTRLLWPWNSPGKKNGVGWHSLPQGIFPTQGSNLGLLHWQVDFLPSEPPGSTLVSHYTNEMRGEKANDVPPSVPSKLLLDTWLESLRRTLRISQLANFSFFFPPATGKRLTLEIIAQQAFLPGLAVRANYIKEKTKQNKTHNSQISFDLMDRVYSLGKTNRKSTLSQ